MFMQWADEAFPNAKAFDGKRGECVRFENYGIRLIQTGKDRFTVIYGKQRKDLLDYSEAASELGACIMHALACDSKLDNREKHED